MFEQSNICKSSLNELKRKELKLHLRDEKGHFLKGTSGGTGRPAESLGRKNIKKIMNNEIDTISKMIFGMTFEELEKELKDQGKLTAAAQLLIHQVVKEKNLKALELLMDRVLGKPTQYTEVEVDSDNTPIFKIVPYRPSDKTEINE